ncbi:MAG: BamA/TamA family outer membrane protein [candidate division Zixibacteria bacterium]|nr:BamA/TamA family outer membrane protein [candidate division Zixibacteria bacterium]
MGILKKGGGFGAGLFFFFLSSFSPFLCAQDFSDTSTVETQNEPAAAPAEGEISWEETWHTLPDRPRPIVARVLFFGNSAFSADRLESKIATRGDSFWGKTGLSFGQHRRAAKDWKYKDIALLSAFYRSRGFLDIHVAESFFHDTVKNELWARIDVSEGKQSFFGAISFSGDAGELTGKLAEAASELESDSSFNVYLLDRAVFRMKEILSNTGYPYARVYLDTVRAEEGQKLPLSFRIEKDGLVHFGRIEIAELAITHPGVVRRELAFKPGEIYGRQKVIQSQQQVYATGLFNFVSLAVAPKMDSSGRKDTLDLHPDFVLRAVERKPAALNLHVGAGQYRRREEQQDLSVDLALGWENRNLGGRARRFSLQGKTSFLVVTDYELLSNKLTADYTEPWILSTRNYANLSVSFEPAVRDRVLGVRIQTATFGLTFLRPISLTTRLTLGASLEEINIFDVPPSEEERFKAEKGINVRRKLSASFEKDTRGSILIPTGGSYTRLEGEMLGGPLGGDAHFLKLNFYWNRYQPLAGNNILATRFRWGQAFLIGERRNLPSVDQFYLGGANSLRGYPENSIVPLDTASSRPVKSLFLTSLEIRRPLFWRFWGNLFSDFGNVFRRNKDIVPDDILVTVGAGLQFFTLIGPLRVEYGKRVIHGNLPPGERVHFSILFAF